MMATSEGCVEVFCRRDPAMAESRMRARHRTGRHPIHRDVINPAFLDRASYLAETVVSLGVGTVLLEVDTTRDVDRAELLSAVRAALAR